MRFGYVLLGLVTLACLHITNGEHSSGWRFETRHYSSSATTKPKGERGVIAPIA